MKPKFGLLLSIFALCLALTGCFSQSADDLYTPPKPPSDFQNLDAQIHQVLAAGGEYAAPIQGSYTQQVQLMDLDGDGVQEAIAFFRKTNPDPEESALEIYIYTQDADGNYAVKGVIQGDGTAINSISYVDLGGGPELEMVVSWQISGKVYQLMAYSFEGREITELMRVGYTEYAIMDLDMDNYQEVIVLNINPIEGRYQADFYDLDEESQQMTLRSSAPLSSESTGVTTATTALRTGYLRDSVPALYATLQLTSGVVTDILAWKDGQMVNLTLSAETGQSDATFRFNGDFSVRDINGDSVLEVPQPVALPEPNLVTGGTNFWAIQWIQFDIEGNAWSVYSTYYNSDDGWYLILPNHWEGNIALSRADGSSSTGERGVLFSHWPDDPLETAQPFLTIYKLTGPNREARAKLGSRFILRTQGDTIYAASFADNAWDCGLDEETLIQQFRLIQPD